MKLRCFLFFILLVNFSFSFRSLAESDSSKANELFGLQKKIKSISQNISDLKVKKNKLLAELKKLDVQYGKHSTEIKSLEEKVEGLNNDLKINRQQAKVKQKEIDLQKKTLENQVKVAHGMGRNEQLKLILNQKDPSVSARILVYYDYLNKARLQKIKKTAQDMQILQDLETEYLRDVDLLQHRMDEIKEKRALLVQAKDERKTLLVKIRQRFSSKKKQLSKFKIDEKKLKGLILSLQQSISDFPYETGKAKKFSLLKGKLPWPIKGKITKKFGAHRSDSRWDGVLLAAKEGAEIRAVASGRVVFADWLRGYGLLTIIDHGEGYLTLYAFNQSLYKRVGDWLEPGAVIATVGQSGGQAESGVYFGIRRKSKPVNPVKWCRKINLGK